MYLKTVTADEFYEELAENPMATAKKSKEYEVHYFKENGGTLGIVRIGVDNFPEYQLLVDRDYLDDYPSPL